MQVPGLKEVETTESCVQMVRTLPHHPSSPPPLPKLQQGCTVRGNVPHHPLLWLHPRVCSHSAPALASSQIQLLSLPQLPPSAVWCPHGSTGHLACTPQ